jgi:hypothetical protein
LVGAIIGGVEKSIGPEGLSYEKRTKTYESRRGLLGRSSRCRFVVGSGLTSHSAVESSRDAFVSPSALPIPGLKFDKLLVRARFANRADQRMSDGRWSEAGVHRASCWVNSFCDL